MDAIFTALNNQNWSSGKEQSGPSPYLERILYQLSELDKKLKSTGGGCLPKYTIDRLNNACMSHLANEMS